jgi:hypothetical protein
MEKIFHITHITNLASIASDGLVCDNVRIASGLVNQEIGHEHIKARRRQRVVDLPPGGVLADYVPFNFCPRSVILCAIWKRSTNYQGGQEQVVHLEVPIQAAIDGGRRWMFTNMHAELKIADYYNDLGHLGKLRWDYINSNNFTTEERKTHKQAEFLVQYQVPWSCVKRIGVRNEAVAGQVRLALESAIHRPAVVIQPSWYYL